MMSFVSGVAASRRCVSRVTHCASAQLCSTFFTRKTDAFFTRWGVKKSWADDRSVFMKMSTKVNRALEFYPAGFHRFWTLSYPELKGAQQYWGVWLDILTSLASLITSSVSCMTTWRSGWNLEIAREEFPMPPPTSTTTPLLGKDFQSKATLVSAHIRTRAKGVMFTVDNGVGVF